MYNFKKARASFKKVFSKFFMIKNESITAKMILFGCNTFEIIQRKAAYNFIKRIENSENSILNVLYYSLFFRNCTLNIQWKKMLYN